MKLLHLKIYLVFYLFSFFKRVVLSTVCVIPGFVSFFSDIPGPCDEVLAQIGNDRVGAHHLRAEDVAENTVIVVEVDC